MRTAGAVLLAAIAVCALLAPWLAPHPPDARFTRLLHAPPTQLHLRGGVDGRWQRPFIHPWVRVDQLEQRYEEDRSQAVAIRWFADGHLLRSADETRAPLLLLGADTIGRDVFSRLLFGARTSLALALAAAVGALVIGLIVGGAAGLAGRTLDDGLMRASEFVLVLPTMYVALALRTAMPLVLPPAAIFLLLGGIFTVVGAPFIARGVRAIVRSERGLDYAVAATSLGASRTRLLCVHLLPASRPFIAVQLTMLVPSFIVAETTLSYIGLGFPEPVASWGTMLQEAANIRTFNDFPWLLSPAAAMFLVVLGLNLVLGSPADATARRLRNGRRAAAPDQPPPGLRNV